MFKPFRLFVIFMILMFFVACGGGEAPATEEAASEPAATEAATEPTSTPEPEPTETPTEEPTPEPTATPTEEPTPEPTATPTEEPAALPDLEGATITIAVENAYLPFNYIDLETGEAAGWDYDFIAEMCDRLNCVPDYIETRWDGMIVAVSEGQFDMAADGITITEERAEIVDFSNGYIDIEQRLLVQLGEDRFASIDEFVDDDGLLIGTQLGTTNYDTALELVGMDRVTPFDDFGLSVQALLAGDVDAVIIDETAGQGYIGVNADQLTLVGESLSSDQLGFIFPKGSDLVEPVNLAIQSMQEDGFLAELNGQYFSDSFDVTYDDIGDGAYAVEVLPLSEEAYVHPSQSFSLNPPEGWIQSQEDEFSVVYGNETDTSAVTAFFIDMGQVLDQETFETTADLMAEGFLSNAVPEYEIVEQETFDDGSIWYTSTFSSPDIGEGIIDQLIIPTEEVIFVIAFLSSDYEALQATWFEVVGTYLIDPDAVIATRPEAEPDPTATTVPAAPTATPLPPTPAPAANPFIPPEGVARVFLFNEYSAEYNIDFGDGSGSIQVPPGAENFFHDLAPGSYNPGLSLPGAGAANVQFDIQAGQSYGILVDGESRVSSGQLYP